MLSIDLIRNLTVIALPFLFALVFAEVARGYVAYYLGDNTGRNMGRLTFDPIKHIDPTNTIVLPLIVYFISGGLAFMGSAKPVPVSYRGFNPIKKAIILISLARPFAHLLQALLWAIIHILAMRFNGNEFILFMADAGLRLNCMLLAFTLLPLPPYDGGNIISCLLPYRYAVRYERLAQYSLWILIALIISGILFNFWLFPITKIVIYIISLLLSPFVLLI